jgi:NAD-dependent DNA ligase
MSDLRSEIAYELWFQKQLNTIGAWQWNDTGVDVILTDTTGNSDVTIKQMVDFFASIGAPHLKDGTVTKLVNCGVDSIAGVINCSEWQLSQLLGANGAKAHAGLHAILSDIPVYKLLGAHASQRGLGVRKIKKLQMAFGADKLLSAHTYPISHIAAVDGFDTKTAAKVIEATTDFIPFFESIKQHVTINTDDLVNNDGMFADQSICITGFRDKELSALIEQLGGKVQTTVSSKTSIVVAADPNSSSGKAKKARELGVRVIGVQEFQQMIADQ